MPPPIAYVQWQTSSLSPSAYLNPSLKMVTKRIRKETDMLKEADQKVNEHTQKKKKKTYVDKKRRATVGL